MCGWLQRWDNVVSHYKRHEMFAHDPFVVNDISECIYYALGIEPQQQNIGKSYWCSKMAGPTEFQVQTLPSDHQWHYRREQLDSNTGKLCRAKMAAIAEKIYLRL